MKPRSVLVPNDSAVVDALRAVLASDAKLDQAESLSDMLDRVKSGVHYDLVLIKPVQGQETARVLDYIHSTRPVTLVALLVPGNDMAHASTWLDAGAVDVLAMPLQPGSLEFLFRRMETLRRLRQENIYHRNASLGASEEPVGRSDAMRLVFRSAEQSAQNLEPVLIVGERGTGKDLLARLIHRRSNHSAGPLVRIDCAAYPGSLLERELFGALGGAHDSRRGLLDLAFNGTLLIDNVADMSAVAQQRVLAHIKSADGRARLVCMSPVDLEQRVRNGLFNSELGQILAAHTLTLPTLTQRPGDIDLLSDYFLRVFKTDAGKPGLILEPAAREALNGYTWPGNVLELRLSLQRAVFQARGATITVADLALPGAAAPSAAASPAFAPNVAPIGVPSGAGQVVVNVGSSLADVEKELILRTIEMTRGNRTKAAQILGISIRTLYSKLLEYDHPSSRKRETTRIVRANGFGT